MKEEVYALNSLEEAETTDGNDSVLVIRAHGIPPETYNRLKSMDFHIVDKTCPYVRKIHLLVKEKYLNGYRIIILGDESHPEIIGINGECNNEAVILKSGSHIDEVEGKFDRNDLICVVAQTTFNVDEFEIIQGMIKEKFINA